MLSIKLAIASLAGLVNTALGPHDLMYDALSNYNQVKTYYYMGSGNILAGDIFKPDGDGPISLIQGAFVNTAPAGGNYYVTATIWSDNFQTSLGSVTGYFTIPALTPPNTAEVFVLTFSSVNIPLFAPNWVHGISFQISHPFIDPIQLPFTPLFGNHPALVGTDYTGFSIDTNANGMLEPNLPIPNQEWYTPSPQWTHANLLCQVFEPRFQQPGLGAGMPQFTVERVPIKVDSSLPLSKAVFPSKKAR